MLGSFQISMNVVEIHQSVVMDLVPIRLARICVSVHKVIHSITSLALVTNIENNTKIDIKILLNIQIWMNARNPTLMVAFLNVVIKMKSVLILWGDSIVHAHGHFLATDLVLVCRYIEYHKNS